jgi:N-dimethylarginine dimethylaminohydrolase
MALNDFKPKADQAVKFAQDLQKEAYTTNKPVPKDTPSRSPFQVFVLCQPLFVDTKIENNVWMKKLNGDAGEIDKEAFMGEWFNLFKILSAESLIYLIPPKHGLQDQVYVNSFCYLPHLKKKDLCLLSNFTAAGRAGEEMVAGKFLNDLGYETIKSPFKFEGEAELKYLTGNIYFGGYGQRSDIQTYKWIERKYGAKVITVKETSPKLYHLDCSLFVLDPENVMACTSLFDKSTIKEMEKVANIHSVSEASCNECICNSVRVGELVMMASSLRFMSKGDPEYPKERKKNDAAEKICRDLGLELMYIEMKEASKSGAALSCMVNHLNFRY